MKRIRVFLAALALGVITSAFIPKDIKAAGISEKKQIEQAIEKKLPSSESVQKFFYYDYDKNGRKEAFVLTGKKSNAWGDTPYKLWFAYVKNHKVVTKSLDSNVLQYSKILKLKSTTLFMAETYATTSSPADLYLVKGNTVKKIFHGDTISKLKGNSFTSIHSTYDGSTNGTGHTFKPYYFYYKKGKIYQYTAKNISMSQFKKRYSNAQKMLNKYKANGKVIGILYRSNNILHVNYRNTRNGNNSYVTFTVSGKKLVKPQRGAGTYLKKM